MADNGDRISSIKALVLDLPPSCIEFCVDHPEYFVVGTYNLQQEDAAAAVNQQGDNESQEPSPRREQRRSGSLLVFQVVGDDARLVQTLPQPSAILDLHFGPYSAQSQLAVVSSTGTLSLFELESGSTPLKHTSTCQILGPDTDGILVLSCAWHPKVPGLIAVTTSAHEVHVITLLSLEKGDLPQRNAVMTHTLEAWTVAFSLQSVVSFAEPDWTVPKSSTQTFTIFSGGDDSILQYTACVYRHPASVEDEEVIESPWPVVKVRGHDAGVTAILPLPVVLEDGATVVLTGSYDDQIRCFAIHEHAEGVVKQRATLLVEENLGGGVWRLKLIEIEGVYSKPTPSSRWKVLVLASCMHAGARILEVSGDYEGRVEVIVKARFEEHKSMNYGCDFQPLLMGQTMVGQQPDLLCASVSFYDKLLCLWRYPRGD